MDVLQGVANTFTPDQKKEAGKIQDQIAELTQVILAEKQSMDSNFVRLSQLINEVRAKKYWLLGNFRTFGDYLADCETKFNIGHSQLYIGMKITRNLLPSMAEQDLVDIGISKAGVLSKYVEQSGQTTIPDDILLAAKDSKVTKDQLDAAVNTKLHNVTQEQGKWMNLGGFFVDEDERKEIEDALAIAASLDPVIPNTIPAWQQQKERILRLSREFISSWSNG